jgi:integrase
MPRKRLTKISVERMRAPARDKQQVRIFDAIMPGLVLRVSFGGSKTWFALHYENSKAQMVKLGRYPVMSLDAARIAAQRFLADPHAALRQAHSGTFEEVMDDFLKRHVYAKRLISGNEIERTLRKHVLPEWGRKLFHEIKRGDVSRLLDKIEDGSGPRAADVVLAHIRKMANWFATRNGEYVSPIVKGMNRSNPGERRRKRILSDDEIRLLWRTTADLGSYGGLVRLLLLTTQRRQKCGTMKRTDIVDGLWSIRSASEREKGTLEQVRLPPLALAVIQAQPRIEGNPFVFPASIGKGPFNSFSEKKLELDARMRAKMPEMKPGVLHDLRRTGRSLMSRAGIPREISERVVGHAIPGVEGVYDLHRYLEEKSAALGRLAALISQILDPQANVVPIRADLINNPRHVVIEHAF